MHAAAEEPALPAIDKPDAAALPASPLQVDVDASSGQLTASIDLGAHPGRGGASPGLRLVHQPGGNGVFGAGWSLPVPAVSRADDERLPAYRDAGVDADAFVLADAGRLVPALRRVGQRWERDARARGAERVTRFRPRVGHEAQRIEWIVAADGTSRWEVTTGDGAVQRYGTTAASRVFDPADPARVSAWLLDEVADVAGNLCRFEYAGENLAEVPESDVAERHRRGAARDEAGRHLKWIRWGNAVPGQPGAWRFVTVLDYGEHAEVPGPELVRPWTVRPDRFSTYRAGFEVRCRRRCARVVHFHRDPAANRLEPVKAVELAYDASSGTSRLVRAVVRGYGRAGAGGVRPTQTLPPVELEYTGAAADAPLPPAKVLSAAQAGVDPAALVARGQWLDLDGSGVDGLLTDDGGALAFRPNEGGGRFGARRTLAGQPVSALTAAPIGQPFADGRSAVLDLANGPGFQEHTPRGGWDRHTAFARTPVAVRGGAARQVDLDGDGRADALVAGEHGAAWHRFAGRQGWDVAEGRPLPASAHAALCDRTGHVVLADLSGDGLADLAEVRPGSVRYWPNLGHGGFGEPVTMGGAPALDGPDGFDPRRVRLADVSGTGGADLLYLGPRGVTLHRNLHGDAFAPGVRVGALPPATELESVEVRDLLGTGTGCLVWRSTAPGHRDRAVAYVDLHPGGRPGLLRRARNGFGRLVEAEWRPSTAFARDASRAGRPWRTSLPVVLPLVATLREVDEVTGAERRVTLGYRDGVYDHRAREPRGFRWTERREEHVVAGAGTRRARVTRRWAHTGEPPATLADDPDRWTGDARAADAPATAYHETAGLAARRELWRALVGRPLRVETWDEPLEGGVAGPPGSVVQHGYRLRCFQPAHEGAAPAVAAEALETREVLVPEDAADVLARQQVALEIDDRGRVPVACEVAHPRTAPAIAAQGVRRATVRRTTWGDVDERDGPLRLGVPVASEDHELVGLPPPAARWHTADELRAALAAPVLGQLEDPPAGGGARRRLLRRRQYRYWNGPLSAALPQGQTGPRALLHHSRALALTDAAIARAYGTTVPDADLRAAGYVREADGWWADSPVIRYDPARFLRAVSATDAAGAAQRTEYDPEGLVVTRQVDAAGIALVAEHDPVTLEVRRIVDVHGIAWAARAGPLGLVEATGEGPVAGPDPLAAPTLRCDRDLHAFADRGQPVTIRRRILSDPAEPAAVDETVGYVDGGGAEVLTKIRVADAGAAAWVADERAVADLGGAARRRHAARFSASDAFEPEPAGAPRAVYHRDGAGLVERVEHADGRREQLLTGPWQRVHWDPNDAVLGSPWHAARTAAGAPALALECAEQAARHAGTPRTVLLDPTGAEVASRQDDGAGATVTTTTLLDAVGQPIAVVDGRGVTVETRTYDLLGRVIAVRSADAGASSTLLHAVGRPERRWGARGEHRFHYDAAGRNVRREQRLTGGTWRTAWRVVHGDELPAGHPARARGDGRPWLELDDAGMVVHRARDALGFDTELERWPLADPTATADWSELDAVAPEDVEAAARADLEAAPLTTTTRRDRLGRPREQGGGGATFAFAYGHHAEPRRVTVTRGGTTTTLLDGVDYHPDGEPAVVRYGSGAREEREQDPATGWLARLATFDAGGRAVRDQRFHRDAVGNPIVVVDGAQQTLFFANAVAAPVSRYRYDALYQLREAHGREAALPAGGAGPRGQPPIAPLPHANDAAAVRAYQQRYAYDLAGNLTEIRHAAGGGGWTATYTPAATSNRLDAVSGPDLGDVRHDPAGNLERIGSGVTLRWDDGDLLTGADLGGGGTAHYRHDAGGQRVRRTLARGGGLVDDHVIHGGYERVRRTAAGATALREERFAVDLPAGGAELIVEHGAGAAATERWRFRHADPVGSSRIELDETGALATYEEHAPFGTGAYRSAVDPAASRGRRRFAGQPLDDETGLVHHPQRSYAPWLGRWVSPDPAAMADGPNRYRFCANDPVGRMDPEGLQTVRNEQHVVAESGGQTATFDAWEEGPAGGTMRGQWIARLYPQGCGPSECSPIYEERGAMLNGRRGPATERRGSPFPRVGGDEMPSQGLGEWRDAPRFSEFPPIRVAPTPSPRAHPRVTPRRETPRTAPLAATPETPPVSTPPPATETPVTPPPDPTLDESARVCVEPPPYSVEPPRMSSAPPPVAPVAPPGANPTEQPGTQPQPEERSWWSRGGGNLVLGGLALGVGILMIWNPMGWAALGTAGALFAATMSVSSGIMATTVGGVQLATSDSRTAAQDAEINRGVGLGMTLSTPGGMGGALVGVAVDGTPEGVERYATYGAIAEGVYGLGSAGVGITRGVINARTARQEAQALESLMSLADDVPHVGGQPMASVTGNPALAGELSGVINPPVTAEQLLELGLTPERIAEMPVFLRPQAVSLPGGGTGWVLMDRCQACTAAVARSMAQADPVLASGLPAIEGVAPGAVANAHDVERAVGSVSWHESREAAEALRGVLRAEGANPAQVSTQSRLLVQGRLTTVLQGATGLRGSTAAAYSGRLRPLGELPDGVYAVIVGQGDRPTHIFNMHKAGGSAWTITLVDAQPAGAAIEIVGTWGTQSAASVASHLQQFTYFHFIRLGP